MSKVSENDPEISFAFKNQISIRNFHNNTKVIMWQQHYKLLKKKLKSNN